MAGTASATALRPSSAQALPRRRRLPTTRDRRSQGAAVAREFLKMATPVKVELKMVAGGGTELQRVSKGLREGELSTRVTRFDLLLELEDADVPEDAAAADLDANAAADLDAAAAADPDAAADEGEVATPADA